MSSTVEQIKDRLSLVEIIGGYIKVEKAGSSYKARCPFHNEKTPSFFISPNRGTYYCFGCGAKGDMFSFVEQFEGTDFLGALKTLAEKAGIEIVKENPKIRSERERLYEIMEEATKWFESNLNENTSSKEYLKNRGVTEGSIESWRLGFVPKEWRALYTFLLGKGYTQVEMEKAGLVKKSDDGTKCYDRFRGRIQFPIFDSSGRVVAFSGRILEQEDNEPKYLNSPETPIFIKSKTLYGFHKAKEGIRKFGYSILVEGQMDLVMSHQVGFGNVTATSGTAFSSEQADMIRRISPNIVLAYDGDSAGIKASFRSAKIGLSKDMEVKIVEFPEGMDPADIARSGVEELKSAIKDSKHAVEFFLNVYKKESKDTRALSRKVVSDLLPLVVLIESSVAQSHFISVIAKVTGIKEDALWQDLKKISREDALGDSSVSSVVNTSSNVKKDEISISRVGALERKMASVILWQESLKNPPVDSASLIKNWEEFSHGHGGQKTIASFSEEEKQGLIFEAEAYYDSSTKLTEEVAALLEEIRLEYLKMELARLIKEIEEAESSHDHIRALSLLKRSQDVSKKINDSRRTNRKF